MSFRMACRLLHATPTHNIFDCARAFKDNRGIMRAKNIYIKRDNSISIRNLQNNSFIRSNADDMKIDDPEKEEFDTFSRL